MKTIALIGCGGWGKNHARTLSRLGVLRYLCDTNSTSLKEVGALYPGTELVSDFEKVLNDPAIKGVVIATPPSTHRDLTLRALSKGKDVLVEKPMALHLSDANEMKIEAERRNQILMVGHVLEYHPAVLKIRELLAQGELGRIYTVNSSRLNLGKIRTEENSLWSFAPHDISLLLRLIGENPTRISCHGGAYLSRSIADSTLTTLKFASGVTASISVSWLYPYKDHSLVIVGSHKMAVFNDLLPWNEKLKLFPHRVDWIDGKLPVAQRAEAITVPLEEKEPLTAELEHFLECINTRRQPLTDSRNGIQVLSILEAAQKSLTSNGEPVVPAVEPQKTPVFIHPTAVLDDGATVGEGTKIWHYSHVSAGSRVGKRCNFGQNVFVAKGVSIGDGVKVQNNVSIYEGVELEDYVFCGPSMVFTNVVNPRSQFERKNEYRKTVVKKGATIGANATVVCGHTLGRHSFIGAGAVVTRDVPDFALMIGNPARRVGWMCECGVGRLSFQNKHAVCENCKRSYVQLATDTIAEETNVKGESTNARFKKAA